MNYYLITLKRTRVDWGSDRPLRVNYTVGGENPVEAHKLALVEAAEEDPRGRYYLENIQKI